MGGTASAVSIMSVSGGVRRTSALKIDFRYATAAPVMLSDTQKLTGFLKDTTSNDGFLTVLKANMVTKSIDFAPTGLTASVTEQKALMTMPTLTVMPTSSSSTRRQNTAPKNSALYNHATEIETKVPGGVDQAIKMPKEILCYVSQARIDDEGTWAGQTSPPTSGDSSNTFLAMYDPSRCNPSTAANTTKEYMSYQAWHTGKKGLDLKIHAYLWVYMTDPRTGATPMVAAKTTFAFTAENRLAHIDLLFSIDQSETSASVNRTSSGCARITGEVETDAAGHSRYTQVTSIVDSLTESSTEWDPSGVVERLRNSERAVMKMTSTTAGRAQTQESRSASLSSCDDAAVAQWAASRSGSETNCSTYLAKMRQNKESEKASVLTFTKERGAVQTGTSPSTLGINSGNPAPTHCIDRSAKGEEFIQSYSAYDSQTGDLWIAPPGNTYERFYSYNTTATDRNNKPWVGYDSPRWDYNST